MASSAATVWGPSASAACSSARPPTSRPKNEREGILPSLPHTVVTQSTYDDQNLADPIDTGASTLTARPCGTPDGESLSSSPASAGLPLSDRRVHAPYAHQERGRSAPDRIDGDPRRMVKRVNETGALGEIFPMFVAEMPQAVAGADLRI